MKKCWERKTLKFVWQAGLWGGIPCAMLIPFAAVFVPHIIFEQVRLHPRNPAALCQNFALACLLPHLSTLHVPLVCPSKDLMEVPWVGMTSTLC